MYYFIAPMLGWFVAGVLKFIINYFRYGKEAKSRVGNGGFPSNHTTIVTTVTMLVAFTEGFASPLFALGVALIMIVIIDATGLRKHVGYHAETLNMLELYGMGKKHRESMGHTKIEVLGGLLLGTLLGYLFQFMI